MAPPVVLGLLCWQRREPCMPPLSATNAVPSLWRFLGFGALALVGSRALGCALAARVWGGTRNSVSSTLSHCNISPDIATESRHPIHLQSHGHLGKLGFRVSGLGFRVQEAAQPRPRKRGLRLARWPPRAWRKLRACPAKFPGHVSVAVL